MVHDPNAAGDTFLILGLCNEPNPLSKPTHSAGKPEQQLTSKAKVNVGHARVCLDFKPSLTNSAINGDLHALNLNGVVGADATHARKRSIGFVQGDQLKVLGKYGHPLGCSSILGLLRGNEGCPELAFDTWEYISTL